MGSGDYDKYFITTEYETTVKGDAEFDSRKTAFKKLPLNNFYAILNNDNNEEDYLQYLCKANLITNIARGEECLNFCKLFIYKFKKFSDIKKEFTGVKETEFCNYFNYWLGGELLRIGASTYNISKFIEIFGMLSSQKYIPGCTCKNNKITSSDFKKMKKYFDYAENLEGINNSEKEEFKNTHDDIYCYYIAKAVNEYNNVISNESCVNNECSFKEELDCFKEKFIRYQKSFRMKCSDIISIPCIQISKEEYDNSCPLGTTVKPPSHTAAHMPDQKEDGASGNSKTLATTSASAAVGIIFTSLILYKVTDYYILINMSVTLTYV
ncbi:hypothetical protein PVIIG_02693 [Plasmodium vivax India VII]|uniref:Uncharacterized protein n=1 Tax=Plasmodium vivax India VII TaxID=1077284 RepID=A0A0J9SF13_PLAVI|nr:hypothetical protein PVIIG_02693 [Plasmodium vivax India VII]